MSRGPMRRVVRRITRKRHNVMDRRRAPTVIDIELECGHRIRRTIAEDSGSNRAFCNLCKLTEQDPNA